MKIIETCKSVSVLVLLALSLSTNAVAQNNGGPNGQPFQMLQAQIDQIAADLDDLATDNSAAIAALQSDVAALQTTVSNLQSQIDSNNIDISNLQTITADNIAAIASLEADNLNLQGQISSNDIEISDLQIAIGNNENAISLLELSTANLQSQIDSNDIDISSLQVAISDNSSNIAVLESNIMDLQNQINVLSTELLGKQDVLDGDGTCPEGSSIRVIDPDGGFLCEQNNSNGFLSVTTAFSPLTFVETDRNGRGKTLSVNCPFGWTATGGGFTVLNPNTQNRVSLDESRPNGNGWLIIARPALVSTEVFNVRVLAVCVRNN